MMRNQTSQFSSERPSQAVGVIEYTSIARGIEAADLMLKTAEIRLLVSRTICPGKYMSVIAGDTAAVASSLDAAEALCERDMVDRWMIPNLHEDVLPAIEGMQMMEPGEALGVIETFSVSSLLEAADTAAKAASVRLLEIRLAMAIGGKAFVTLTGDVSAVRTAVDAGAAKAGKQGMLVNKVVIANPRPEVMRDMI